MTASPAPQPTDPFELADRSADRGYLVRSEEQVRVGTQRVVAGYARLEKFTVTETKTITVEVTHEEVRLVQAAAAGDPRNERTQDGSPQPAADRDRWMVLSREEVVITMQVVPMERVRLEVYPVTEQRQVTEQVRKEQIDTEPETAWTSGRDSAALT